MNPITAFLAAACVLVSLTTGYLMTPFVALLSFGSALVNGVGDDSRRLTTARFQGRRVETQISQRLGISAVAPGSNADAAVRIKTRMPARAKNPLNPAGIRKRAIAASQARRAEHVSRCHQILQASLGPGFREPRWRCVRLQGHG